ncbi:nucleotide exchange factor GrpE [Pseudolysinimonas yzui]|uniref:Protein GrpE n=1 Tax=Pseudolysinimonas yzui TaxID=2708254 RepID=A0A8J3M2L3_9MICO|nr:nucleotide exchange factor GrpE [Pseudolysinimonas yzui]GHF21821.1 protein GrpE [Pseudolysinimonas yzui]
MTDDAKDKTPKGDDDAPKIHDKRKIDPDTGEARVTEPVADGFRKKPTDEPVEDSTVDSDEPAVDEAPEADDIPLIAAEGADVEFTDEDLELLAEAERDLVAEYRDRAARAEAELKNFRTRVERDRQANREVVIAEVIRSLLPAIDDLDRADAHGDLVEGSPLAIVAQKIRAGFDKYGLVKVGEKGERFDPKLHEALVRLPSADVEFDTVADVIEPGYLIGERLIRAAKVAVSSPE